MKFKRHGSTGTVLFLSAKDVNGMAYDDMEVMICTGSAPPGQGIVCAAVSGSECGANVNAADSSVVFSAGLCHNKKYISYRRPVILKPAPVRRGFWRRQKRRFSMITQTFAEDISSENELPGGPERCHPVSGGKTE